MLFKFSPLRVDIQGLECLTAKAENLNSGELERVVQLYACIMLAFFHFLPAPRYNQRGGQLTMATKPQLHACRRAGRELYERRGRKFMQFHNFALHYAMCGDSILRGINKHRIVAGLSWTVWTRRPLPCSRQHRPISIGGSDWDGTARSESGKIAWNQLQANVTAIAPAQHQRATAAQFALKSIKSKSSPHSSDYLGRSRFRQ